MADKILTIGERIKQIRINNGLTFRQFGGFLDATAEYGYYVKLYIVSTMTSK